MTVRDCRNSTADSFVIETYAETTERRIRAQRKQTKSDIEDFAFCFSPFTTEKIKVLYVIQYARRAVQLTYAVVQGTCTTGTVPYFRV